MSRVTIEKMLQSYHIKEWCNQTIGELHMRTRRVPFQEFIIFPGYVKPNHVAAHTGFSFNIKTVISKTSLNKLLVILIDS